MPEEPIAPKPPEILEKVVWFERFGLRFAPHLLCIALLYITHELYKANLSLVTDNIALQDQLKDYRGCRTESPDGDPPIQVTFKDGVTMYVNFHTLTRIDWKRVDYASKRFFDPLEAHAALMADVKAKTYSTLETRTSKEARAERLALSTLIMEQTNEMQRETAFQIDKFDLLEFCLAAAPQIK